MDHPDAAFTPQSSKLRAEWNERARELDDGDGRAKLEALLNEHAQRLNELLTLCMHYEFELRVLRGRVVPDLDDSGRRLFRDLDRPDDPPKYLD